MPNPLDEARLQRAARHTLQPTHWDGPRAERVWAGIPTRRRNRRAARAALTAAAITTAALLLALLLPAWLSAPSPQPQPDLATTTLTAAALTPPSADPAHTAPQDPTSPPDLAAPQALTLSDGSVVHMDPDADLHITQHPSGGALITLTHGGATFEVTPRRDAPFIVEAASVRVVVLGTRFRVTRDAEAVTVSVTHGRVRAEHRDAAEVLRAHDTRRFPLTDHSDPTPSPQPTPQPALRALTLTLRDGALRGLLAASTPTSTTLSAVTPPAPATPKPKPSAADLAAAADAARSAGDTPQALRLLDQLLRDHPRSRYVSAAALTQAKLLIQSGRACEAADGLQRAQAAAPQDPLTQDLIAREVEALLRCGLSDRARARADAYLRLYPDGAHAPRVRDLIAAPASP